MAGLLPKKNTVGVCAPRALGPFFSSCGKQTAHLPTTLSGLSDLHRSRAHGFHRQFRLSPSAPSSTSPLPESALPSALREECTEPHCADKDCQTIPVAPLPGSRRPSSCAWP